MSLLQNSKFWLLAIAAGLVSTHLNMSWKVSGNLDPIIVSLLFWGAVLFLLSHNHIGANLESGPISSVSGFLLIGWSLLRSISTHTRDDVLFETLPFFSAIGLSLISSGTKGFKQYRQELFLIFILCIPTALIIQSDKLFSVTTLTAKFSTILLWYLGFNVSRQGQIITLPTGSIDVTPLCGGLISIIVVLRLAILFVTTFRINWLKKVSILALTVGSAFIVNGVRIAILAILVSKPEPFNYWHYGDGSQIFTMISLLTAGLLCHLVFQQERSKHHGSIEECQE